MKLRTRQLLPELRSFVGSLDITSIADERKEMLQVLIDHVQNKRDVRQAIALNFICTHNSRRSQFAQLWAQAAAYHHGIDLQSFSGGMEVSAFDKRAVACVQRFGFGVSSEGGENPRYAVQYTESNEPLVMFSKLFDDPANTAEQFIAVMTCSHADENCPFIPGAETRIPLPYEDPKISDGTDREYQMYDERSRQITAEMFYAFSEVV